MNDRNQTIRIPIGSDISIAEAQAIVDTELRAKGINARVVVLDGPDEHLRRERHLLLAQLMSQRPVPAGVSDIFTKQPSPGASARIAAAEAKRARRNAKRLAGIAGAKA